MKKSMFLSISLATCITASAFALEAPAVPASTPQTPATAPSATPTATPAAPAAAAVKPAPVTPPAPVALSGKVLQTMNGGGYSYIYIEQADGSKKWIAVTQMSVKVGDQMSFKPGMDMGRFESKALNRSFDSIVFSEGVISGGSIDPILDPGKNQGVSPGSEGAAIKEKKGKIAVSKATGPNAITVAEAYSNTAALNGKRVVIHAQVVKVSGGILGKNWIHVQDGTGSDRRKTHNLVVTSRTGRVDVGQVITVTGTLVKDRNFGSGYRYPVIIEDAEISQ